MPLAVRIHEGLVWSNRDQRTLLDKMVALLDIVALPQPFYLVADAYYASRKIINGLLARGNHLVTRAKSNAVAYTVHRPHGAKTRGRPRLYGDKVKLASLFGDARTLLCAPSPVYGEDDVTVQYRVCDLLWRPVGRVVRFVLVVHPTRGRCILMSTDTSLEAIEVLRLYGLRFKIELAFKQAVQVLGSFAYHFWMKDMKPLCRRNGNQYLHRQSERYRHGIKRKINAYHLFIHTGVVAQALLQYLAVTFAPIVWASFGSWLRTVRPGIPPSELVVSLALRHSFPEFLLNCAADHNIAKFIAERQDHDRMAAFRMVS